MPIRPILRLPGALVALALLGCLSTSVSIDGSFSVNPGSWISIHSGGPGLEVHMTNAGEGDLLVRWREPFWGTRREMPLWPGETRVVPAPHNIKFDISNLGDVATTLLWDTLPEGTQQEAPIDDADGSQAAGGAGG